MIERAGAQDIVYTAAISGVHANFLGPSLAAAGIEGEALKADHKVDFGKELDHEAKAWKTIWSAGQGVASIDKTTTVAELATALKTELAQALNRQTAQADRWKI